MIGVRKKRRIRLIAIGLGMMIVATALMGYAFRDGIALWRAPSQIVADPPADGVRIRLGGMVKQDSWERGTTHSFVITDSAADVWVSYTGIVPDLFAECEGTVVTGSFQQGVFVATEVLAKHDETYMPAEVIDALSAQGVDINYLCGDTHYGDEAGVQG